VIRPQINLNTIHIYKDSVEKRKCFFYPATSFTYKNHRIILEALRILKNKGYNDYEVNFTISKGENHHTEELYNFAQANSLKVNFLGSISRERVFKFYSTSILLFPSFVESFGLPLYEARQSETFVIASDCSFSREILQNYDNSLFFNPQDANELAKCILELNKKEYSPSLSKHNNDLSTNSLINFCKNSLARP
jgi:glycosyltransferase involved in cell wall biosynthesis